MTRKALGKRVRFEVMKRDGFSCRYCGANGMSTVLEVDHILAVANGGTDDPSNLITACRDCNAGKSDVPLDELALKPTSMEAVHEHAEQLREYAAACKELQQARQDIAQLVVNHWCDRIDPSGMPRTLYNAIHYWLDELGLEVVLKAIENTGQHKDLRHPDRYLIAMLRNRRRFEEDTRRLRS